MPVLTPSVRSIIRSHPELSGLSDQECERIYAGISRRHRWRSWGPPMATGLTSIIAWIVCYEMFEWWLYDQGVFGSHPWVAALFVFFVPLGVAIATSVLIYRTRTRAFLRPTVERALDGKRCLWCGYCLTGLEVTDRRVRCPECGDHSPVRP